MRLREDEDDIPVATNWFDQFRVELEARHYQVYDAYHRRDQGFYLVTVPLPEQTLDAEAITKRLDYFATHWFSTAFGDKVWVSVEKPVANYPMMRFIKVTVPSLVREDEEFDPAEVEQLAGVGFYDDERQRLIKLHDVLTAAGLKVDTIHQFNTANRPSKVQVTGEGVEPPDDVKQEYAKFLKLFTDEGKPPPDYLVTARIMDILMGIYYQKIATVAANAVGMVLKVPPLANSSIAYKNGFVMELTVEPLTQFAGTITLDRLIPFTPPEAEPVEESEIDPEEIEQTAGAWGGIKIKLIRFLKPLGDEGYYPLAAYVYVNQPLNDAKVIRVMIKPEGLLADDLRNAFERAHDGYTDATGLQRLEQRFTWELDAVLRKSGAQIENGTGHYYPAWHGGVFVYTVAVGIDDPIVDDKTVLGNETVWTGGPTPPRHRQ